MKKSIIFIMSLVFIVDMAFGVPLATSELGIHLDVQGVYEVKILEDAVFTVPDFNDGTTVAEHEFVNAPYVATYYLTVKTNNKNGVKVNVVLEHMKNAELATTIGYDVMCGAIIVSSTASSVESLLYTEPLPLSQNGMRVVSQAFTITLDSTDVANATAGLYTSDVYFNLVSL
jgi:hypothetical protein